jgi:hypothetical protein
MKNGLAMKFEKEKKKKRNSADFLSAQMAQAAHQATPRRPTSPLLLFFFPCGANIRGPPVSLPSPLSFLLPPAAHPSRRRRAIPAAPGRLPTFLSSPRSQLRQSNTP